MRREQITKGVVKEYEPALPEEGRIFKSVTKGYVPTQKGAERIIKSECLKGYVLTQKAEDELFGWISMGLLCESS